MVLHTPCSLHRSIFCSSLCNIHVVPGSCLDDFCFVGSLLIFRGIQALKKLKAPFQAESELFDLEKNVKMFGLITARGLCKAETGWWLPTDQLCQSQVWKLKPSLVSVRAETHQEQPGCGVPFENSGKLGGEKIHCYNFLCRASREMWTHLCEQMQLSAEGERWHLLDLYLQHLFSLAPNITKSSMCQH